MDNILARLQIDLSIHAPPEKGRMRGIDENPIFAFLEEFKIEGEPTRAGEFGKIPVIQLRQGYDGRRSHRHRECNYVRGGPSVPLDKKEEGVRTRNVTIVPCARGTSQVRVNPEARHNPGRIE